MSAKIPKHEAVRNRIATAINQHKLVEKLPGERTLAKEYGVSYMTMRKVIENLVDQGLVYKVPNSGIYVKTAESDHRLSRQVGIKKYRPSAKLISSISKSPDKSKHQTKEHSDKENLARQGFRTSSRLKRLEQENAELKRANEILKRVATYFARIHEERI